VKPKRFNAKKPPKNQRGISSNARSALRDQLKRNRNESFNELMKFNLDTELAEAERSISMVNATQQFVSKAMRGRLTQKRFNKANAKPAKAEETKAQ